MDVFWAKKGDAAKKEGVRVKTKRSLSAKS